VSRVVRQRWLSSLSAEPKRQAGCDYEAYVPDPSKEGFRLRRPGCEQCRRSRIRHLSPQCTGQQPRQHESLARILLRASLSPPPDRGLGGRPRRLLRAEVERSLAKALRRNSCRGIGEHRAMMFAVDQVAPGGSSAWSCPRSSSTLLAVPGSRARRQAPKVQNWIRSSSTTLAAQPSSRPHGICRSLLEDLLPSARRLVARSGTGAIAHAQFETSTPLPTVTAGLEECWSTLSPSPGCRHRVLPPVSLVLAHGRGTTSEV